MGTAAVAQRFLPRIDGIIEGHRPGRLSKLGAIFGRAIALRSWLYEQQPNRMLAVSHNSYAQILAARSLGLPVLTSMDYEGQPANHLAFRFAHRILLPEAFPSWAARRQGARPSKTRRYPGPKEAVYLADFTFNANALERWDTVDRTLAVVRPEAGFAIYHGFGNPWVFKVIDHLLREDAYVVVVPRDEEQRADMHKEWGSDVDMPLEVLDGPSLLARADLFVGAGGTMTREAAVLGTPAYSIYLGRPPAVELDLERQSRLVILRHEAEIQQIKVRKREPNNLPPVDRSTRASVLTEIEDFIKAHR